MPVEVEVIKQVGLDDLAGLQGLFDAARAHDGHAPLGEHKWLDLVHGGRTGHAGVVAGERGAPIGYAHLSRHPEGGQWGLEVVVHPDHRGGAVEEALLGRALEVASQDGGGHLHLWVFQPTDAQDRVAASFGMSAGRTLLHLHVTLPIEQTASLPGGVRLRPFDPETDARAWIDVNNRAFRHHPEQGAWDLPTLRRRVAESWFEASDFLIAEADGQIAAFNWLKVDRARGVGEIYVIGVDPDHQGQGLGRTMAVAGLRHMSDAGCHTGALYVDAANEPAVALYERLGFTVHHVDRAYVVDVEPVAPPGG